MPRLQFHIHMFSGGMGLNNKDLTYVILNPSVFYNWNVSVDQWNMKAE